MTVRIGDHYRALGLLESGSVVWIWIGSHAAYNRLVGGQHLQRVCDMKVEIHSRSEP